MLRTASRGHGPETGQDRSHTTAHPGELRADVPEAVLAFRA